MSIIFYLETLGGDVIVDLISKKYLPLIKDFDCGEGGEEQNKFLWERAWAEYMGGLSSVYILTEKENPDIILSFFTLSPFIIRVDPLPTEVREVIERELGISIPYKQLPTILLGQYGVDKKYRGRGIGKEILGDIIIPIAVKSAAELGGIGLVLHAKKRVAKKFYLRENKYLEGNFEVISKGSMYTLLYVFIEEVRKYRLGEG